MIPKEKDFQFNILFPYKCIPTSTVKFHICDEIIYSKLPEVKLRRSCFMLLEDATYLLFQCLFINPHDLELFLYLFFSFGFLLIFGWLVWFGFFALFLFCFVLKLYCSSNSSSSASLAGNSPKITSSDWAVPQASRLKYRQKFNSLDKSMSGYLSGEYDFRYGLGKAECFLPLNITGWGMESQLGIWLACEIKAEMLVFRPVQERVGFSQPRNGDNHQFIDLGFV